jgi:adenosine deaminase
MQNAANLERVAYEFAVDNFDEGVRYFEVRFAPQLHCSVDPALAFGIVEVCQAVHAGLARARDEFNDALRAANVKGARGGEPHYDFGIIACAMRMFFPGMSRYYDALFALHPHADAKQVTSMASVNLVLAAKEARDAHGIPIVAIDVAGAERDNEAAVHTEAFRLAHRLQFGKTVHAGEGYGPESIWQAVRDLHAERIGHGFHIFSAALVNGAQNQGTDGLGQTFVDNLVKYVSDRRITLEVCLTSNLNTMPDLALKDHALRRMVGSRLSVCLNTDNRLVSNTNMVKELRLAVRTFGLSPKQLREIVITGFKRSFYHGPYTERREYVRQVMNFYDMVAAKHGVASA